MKPALALLLLLAATAAPAADKPASDASIRQLIEVTQSRKLMDGMLGQLDSIMQNSMKQAMGNATFTPEQQAVVDRMRKKMVALLTAEMNWDSLEPEFISIYRQSFTEQEVAGMLEFYKTPAGQAVITKMPVVMQHTMGFMQRKMVAMNPKMQQIQKETLDEMKACCMNDGK